MIILTNTTDTLTVVLGEAHTTIAVDCVASWRDITQTPSYTPGRTVIRTNNTTAVIVVAAPAAGVQRIIDRVSIVNTDSVSHGVTVKYDASTLLYVLWTDTLTAGQKLTFSNSSGWVKSA